MNPEQPSFQENEFVNDAEGREFLKDDDEKRRKLSLSEVSSAIISELKITSSGLPFKEAGIHLDDSMIEIQRDVKTPGMFRAKPEAVESVLTQATKAVEENLNPQNPKKDPYRALIIAEKFVLPRDLLQRAGDSYVASWNIDSLRKTVSHNDRLQNLITYHLLSYDYLPPREILEEAVLNYLKYFAQFGQETVMKIYEELRLKLKEHNIDLAQIVEKDPELEETLTSF